MPSVIDIISSLINRDVMMAAFFSHLIRKYGWTGRVKIKRYKNGVLMFIYTDSEEHASMMEHDMLNILQTYQTNISKIQELEKEKETKIPKPKALEVTKSQIPVKNETREAAEELSEASEEIEKNKDEEGAGDG